MRKLVISGAMLALLSACGSSSGVFGRDRPDEFAVSRAAPLVVPPDFALTPPAPGTPRPQEADSATQALQAMFGGAAQRSPVEGSAVSGRSLASVRMRAIPIRQWSTRVRSRATSSPLQKATGQKPKPPPRSSSIKDRPPGECEKRGDDQ
jgi:Protein of unknown function (DUF3035)